MSYPPPPPPKPSATPSTSTNLFDPKGTSPSSAAVTTATPAFAPLDTPPHRDPRAPLSLDPGDAWLPEIVQDKTKLELTDLFARPALLAALAASPSTAHPSTAAAQAPLHSALEENVQLGARLNELEARLVQLRSSTQTMLLSTHACERQWRQKQSEMDRALAPFSPSALYQKLGQGVAEQEMVCRALEESFLDGDGATATEREAAEWVRRYRDAKKVYYSRRERKERWDEGRVGGWR